MQGLTIRINALCGNGNGYEHVEAAKGKTIAAVLLADDTIHVEFDDHTKLRIADDGQSCCESRYITCDDELTDLVGQKLVDVTLSDGPSSEGEYGDEHDTAFLRIVTDGGEATFTTHVEHNGYYGGFWVQITSA